MQSVVEVLLCPRALRFRCELNPTEGTLVLDVLLYAGIWLVVAEMVEKPGLDVLGLADVETCPATALVVYPQAIHAVARGRILLDLYFIIRCVHSGPCSDTHLHPPFLLANDEISGERSESAVLIC